MTAQGKQIEDLCRKSSDVVLISHHAVFGDRSRLVGKFKVSDVRPFAQYERSVSIFWMTPRARKRWGIITLVPNNTLFYTIEREGDVLYDSRSDIPCDMEVFAKTKAEIKVPMFKSQKQICDRNAGLRTPLSGCGRFSGITGEASSGLNQKRILDQQGKESECMETVWEAKQHVGR